MSNAYDMVVIGSGPAGENAAELAAYFGYRAAIIERNKPGGTPTTRGGAPTKTLREAALALTGFYDQEVYGVELGAPPALALDKLAERTAQVCRSLQAATARRLALMVTMLEDDSVFAAMRAGARGYVVKGAEPSEILWC
jgi:NAD(P) transhydrogenase